ncbi:hypothetical protein PG995_013758 [Apiospora arundinis]
MSRYFPHTAYAEDQPLSHTILTTHVLTRAVTTGAVLGTAMYGVRQVLLPLLSRSAGTAPKPTPAATAAAATVITKAPFQQRFFRATGVTTLWTLGIVSIGLAGRMWGREEIEWQDRSWRLLEHKGQLETDDWTYGGYGCGGGRRRHASRKAGAVLGRRLGRRQYGELGGRGGTDGVPVWNERGHV